MTDNELRELIASTAIAQKETGKQQKETGKQIESLFVSQKETDKLQKETDKLQKETAKRQQQTDKQISDLGKQIGGLGRRIGSFTEGLALPSMQKILQNRFKMEIISPSVRVKKNGKEMEVDVLAYANSAINEVYVVEVKSHLREEGIIQLQKMMKNLREFFPEHSDKKLYGILAAVDMSQRLKKRVLSLGFYTAKIHEEIFSLDIPADFKAKSY